MLAKRFFYVSAGLFLLALTYHLGACSVQAQAGATGFGFAVVTNNALVMTPNGDVYQHSFTYNGDGSMDFTPVVRLGNFWGGATPVTSQTWGQVKDRYRR